MEQNGEVSVATATKVTKKRNSIGRSSDEIGKDMDNLSGTIYSCQREHNDDKAKTRKEQANKNLQAILKLAIWNVRSRRERRAMILTNRIWTILTITQTKKGTGREREIKLQMMAVH